jgi:hypothetical protein
MRTIDVDDLELRLRDFAARWNWERFHGERTRRTSPLLRMPAAC